MAAIASTSLDEISEENRKPDVYANFEYSFSKFSQYAISSLCYCFTPIAYVYFDQSSTNHPPVTLIFITSVFISLPVYYMEAFLGRYTQNSILNLKYMVPIAKGLPFAHLSVTILYTVASGYYLTDTLLYLLMCFQKDLPWATCPENITECYYHSKPPDCQECIHSSMAYWKYIFMNEPALSIDELRLGVPILHRFISSCICWLLIFLITGAAYKQRHKCLSILFYLYLVTIAILFAAVLLNVGATANLPHIFDIASHSYLDASMWAEAMLKSLKLFKLGHAHHVLAGSRLPQKAPIGLWCVSFSLILMGLAMITTMFGMAVGGVQKHHTGAIPEPVIHLHQLFVVVLPGGLSYTGAAHAWSVLFFFSTAMLIIANMVSRIITLQLNITNFKPSMQKFKVYLLVGYCLTFAFISILLLSEKHYIFSQLLLEATTSFMEIITTMLLIVVVFWIYGVQTISDDILFLTNHKPIRFWIITWYICPIVFIVLAGYVMAKMFDIHVYLIIYISTAILLIPLVVCACHQVFVYVKRRRLLGLIEPEVEWGMPDPEERHMRRMFNPRLETKFDSKRRACSHKCIQNSPYLRNVIHCETLNRANVLAAAEIKQEQRKSEDEDDDNRKWIF